MATSTRKEVTKAAKVSGDGAQSAPESADAGFLVPKATRPRQVPRGTGIDHPALLFNRELSWIDFNWRVLYQAMDARVPLLERLLFLSITASNLDEFFRKRVGGLKRQEAAGVRKLSFDGRTPSQQLRLIRTAVVDMFNAMNVLWANELKPDLAEKTDIRICRYEDLTASEQRYLKGYFNSTIYPVLTPLAVDPGHPFPFISNLSLSFAVTLLNTATHTRHFARLKIPSRLKRWIPLPDKPHHLVTVEQVIQHNIALLFRGMKVEDAYLFRVTRNADLRRNEEEADDLVSMITEELRERRFAPVVRIEVNESMPARVRQFLIDELQLSNQDLYEVKGLMDLTAMMDLARLDVPEHKYAPWEPVVPERVQDLGHPGKPANMFAVVKEGDFLVHHPYDSFSATTHRFIEEAADDPDVLAIKQTLYRTSDDSPTLRALMRAAEKGKQVVVLVEVKARFDEENNIEWGQVLEKAGVHVTYGLVGLKTHAKISLVVRQEGDGVVAYCHLGTGNYHPKTARLYTDLGYLTCRPALGTDMVNLFHFLTGYAPEQEYGELLVAPKYMRDIFYSEIHREIENQKKYGSGKIIAKMNGLDDPDTIQELYKASQAGVKIDLVVRGHCRLRPGLPKISENIKVVSILGRFLEHNRIYCFHNNGRPKVYMGSADWQRRNLRKRVETAFRVPDPEASDRLVSLIELALNDNRSAWDLQPDGQYVQRRPAPDEDVRCYQEMLMKMAEEQVLVS